MLPRLCSLVVGNWKMFGSEQQNSLLLESLKSTQLVTVDVAVCVPYPYLSQCRDLLASSTIAWGAQDVSLHEQGAYTGEVSAVMLCDFSCRYVIVGHSERRRYHAEDNDVVGRKAAVAIKHGLSPIVCIGETLAEREQGNTASVLLSQLQAVFAHCAADNWQNITVAYEPVWAIGTGQSATPQMVAEAHQLIRSHLCQHAGTWGEQCRILYGGSVKPDNASTLLKIENVGGALVGAASLVAQDFLSIARAV